MATIKGGTNDGLREALQGVERRLRNASAVRVGFLEGATYPDGKPVAMIAAIHNYGKWPFFTNMIAKKKHEWGPAIRQLLIDNDSDALRTLQQTGEAISGQLRQEIVDTVTPSNAPATIMKKGFDKPLVESGHMLQSVDYQVKA